jgi:malate dehydrogenase (oxaloacetate-decarboxylating)
VGRRLADERVVFLGAGASGAGCALAVRAAMREDGVPAAELGRRVLCIDSRGLILADRAGLEGEKKEIAADPSVVQGCVLARGGVAGLEDVARHFAPTVLIGASGQPGAFTQTVIRAMHAQCPRPIVLPISNPTSKAEATPEDVLRWTGGAAVVGTGSPFPPVSIGGVVHQIGQGNNAFIFPGVGLGATAVSARWLPDAAFTAAARALDEATGSAAAPGSPIYPPLRRLRETSVSVARAVARALVEEGAADAVSGDEIDARILDRMWEPRYRPYRAAALSGAVHG